MALDIEKKEYSVEDHVLNGCLIVNADDWGQDIDTTDRILKCVLAGYVSSASAMVFMKDSERAAEIARTEKVDCGLHLNLSSPFTLPNCNLKLTAHQQKIRRAVKPGLLTKSIFHPLLRESFDYVVKAQLDEFVRLYGTPVQRIDGHHHMHLCANVLAQKLLPAGVIVRRNFSFQRGEKSYWNRWFRRQQDKRLAQHYYLTDFLFSLFPLEPESYLQKKINFAKTFRVEIETHPANDNEYQFLMSGCLQDRAGQVEIARQYSSHQL